MANYRATQSPTVVLAVLTPDVTYTTVMSLSFMRGGAVLASGSSVAAGDSVTAVANLMTSTGLPVQSASVVLTATSPTLVSTTLTGVTDASGNASIDLTSWIKSAANQGGAFTFVASFDGILPTVGYAGFYASGIESSLESLVW